MLVDEAEPIRLNRRGRTAVIALVLLLIAGILVGGGLLAVRVVAHSSAPADFAGPGAGQIVVQVKDGDTATAIGRTLAAKGVVKTVGAFQDVANADPRAAEVQPGFYTLMSHMSARGALALLLDPTARLRSRVTIPEGTSLKELLPRLAQNTPVPLADLIAASKRPATLGLPSYAQGQVEGFLFPATYDVPPNATATQLLTLLTARFTEMAQKLDLVNGAKALGYTPLQVVTIASIIERESAAGPDAPKVAEVFYNRLKAGLALGSEFTVRYAGGDKNSPYNTYTHKGFPPGPYDSPGQTSLQAALHPATGDALFFVTLPKEGTKFVHTEAEFYQLAAQCKAEGGC
jgi:UPF0755 protein